MCQGGNRKGIRKRPSLRGGRLEFRRGLGIGLALGVAGGFSCNLRHGQDQDRAGRGADAADARKVYNLYR